MFVPDLIVKKRDGGELSSEEIEHLINGFNEGRIPDYQMSAFLMAVYFQGMSHGETAALTMALVKSGEVVDLSDIPGVVIDKHSSGGVGDKVTLVLAPLLATAGAKVAKVAGRGLGFTGGTVDKLESIPGFCSTLKTTEFRYNLQHYGIALTGQTAQFTPADRKLYALRDVTGTVDSIPLIASSIMSKKIAAGSPHIFLDVKVGRGAFLKSKEDAFTLGNVMVNIGNNLGRRTAAAVTDMTQPLGRAVGNLLEVKEAVETLLGQGPSDLEKLCLWLGGNILNFTGLARSEVEGKNRLEKALRDGSAFNKFKEFIRAQGGDESLIEDPEKLPRAKEKMAFPAPRTGYIRELDAELIGRAAVYLGAGRASKEESIDPTAGIVLQKKIGDKVEAGEPLIYIHYNALRRTEPIVPLLSSAFVIDDFPVKPPPLVYGSIFPESQD